MELRLIHQSPQAGPIPAGAILWRTCLRELAFVTASTPPGPQLVLEDDEAYALLVEVVSGLRSPLLGETEVQAQFKAFLAALDPARDAALRRLGQRVLGDVKTIRSRHLQGVGAHSYAALAGLHVVAGTRIVILGTGAMADALVETFGAAHEIDQWGRRADAVVATGPGHRFFVYGGGQPDAETGTPISLIVAAPVAAAPLSGVLERYGRVAAAIDLRPADARVQAPVAGNVVTLDDLFRAAGQTPLIARDRVAAARADIRELARAYASRLEMRPYGWDDLCV